MGAFRRSYLYILFIGDVFVLYFSLWITLVIRYWRWPTNDLLAVHLVPFSWVFLVWLAVFYLGGLYEKRTLILRDRLPRAIVQTHLTNSALAVVFFYLIPYFTITPKTSLFIYIVVSLVLLLLWRLYGVSLLVPRQRQNALLIASGEEMWQLRDEVNNHPHYGLSFLSTVDLSRLASIDFNEEVVQRVYSDHVSVVVADFKDNQAEPILSLLYNLIFSKVIFIDMYKLYESVFDRIPLSLIEYSWFLENISLRPKRGYDFGKRIMDILIALPLGLLSLVVYPFVIVAIKIEDGGPAFIVQKRIGKDGRQVSTYKFRSMTRNDVNLSDTAKSDNVVTRVGRLLRKSRIDELPQLWNVIFGDLSLIGPRPELPVAVARYEQEIPYYGIRHLIKPGLSGWAQLYHDDHAHHALGVQSTKEKLSYDLYYLKNRSFLLDIRIALKTIKKLIAFAGA